LVGKQNEDGSWGLNHKVASTGFAVLKLETHAILQGKYPLDSSYEYKDYILSGLDYLFSKVQKEAIGIQAAGNPDTNINGRGFFFNELWNGQGNSIFSTSIALAAIASGEEPERIVNVTGNGSIANGLTYGEVAQDIVDYLVWAQTDFDDGRGGWSSQPKDNEGGRSDNSNSRWAVLGLAKSQWSKFYCKVPDFVKFELNKWIDYIQNDMDGDKNDGGSGYSNPDEGANIYLTGGLIHEIAFYGDNKT